MIWPPEVDAVRDAGRLSVAADTLTLVLLCSASRMVPAAAPETVIDPVPPALRLPAAR